MPDTRFATFDELMDITEPEVRPLTAEECEIWAAEPLVLHEQQVKENRQKAVKQLLKR